jgi:hypothetical protein
LIGIIVATGPSWRTALLPFLPEGTEGADSRLFRDPDRYVNLPLEPTYLAAYQGMPAYRRGVL